jgi:hypothetical protein
MLGGCGLELSVSGQGLVMGFCEQGNETLGSKNDEEFLDQLSALLASQEGLCSMEFVRILVWFQKQFLTLLSFQ